MALGRREAASDCDGRAWLAARSKGADELLSSVGRTEELKCQPARLIRNRTELRNGKNNMTQRCFLCSL